MTDFEKYVNAAEAFYNGQPVLMSDEDYDELEKKVLEDHPGFNVKTFITFHQQGMKVKHHAHFLPYTKSTDKNLTYEELKKFGKYLTPKYDGCSIVAYYRDGKCYQIISRADDIIGANQYDKLKAKVIPEVDPSITEIFYEAVTNLKFGDRSKANGLVNSKYLQDEVNEKLTLMPCECYSEDEDVRIEFMEEYTHLVTKDEMDYIITHGQLEDGTPVDGIVAYDPVKYALKMRKIYFNGSKITKILGHELTFSTNTMTHSAVCKLNPIKLDGANIRNVKAGPFGTMKRMGLGIGSEVEIIRSNKVIPHITNIISRSDDFSDVKCLCCRSELHPIGNDLICINESCDAMNNILLMRLNKIIFKEDINGIIIAKYGKKNKDFIKGVNEWIESSGCKDEVIEKIKSFGLNEMDSLLSIPRLDRSKYNDEFNRMITDEEDLKSKYSVLRNGLSQLQKDHSELLMNRINRLMDQINL